MCSWSAEHDLFIHLWRLFISRNMRSTFCYLQNDSRTIRCIATMLTTNICDAHRKNIWKFAVGCHYVIVLLPSQCIEYMNANREPRTSYPLLLNKTFVKNVEMTS